MAREAPREPAADGLVNQLLRLLPGPVALVGSIDPAGLAEALAAAAIGVARHPGPALAVVSRRTEELAGELYTTAMRVADGEPELLAGPPPDKRFADPAWSRNPAYATLLQCYQAATLLAYELVDTAQLDRGTAAKARFATGLLSDAVAPTNFLLTNPAALRRAFDTGGRSVLAGARNMLDDLVRRRGQPRQVDPTPFRLGENLAATPCTVVYRNHLVELLQYAPRTKQVHETPLLVSPPWINKYYILDLAPGRSLIEWAVDAGHTVFALSYRNPDSSMRDASFDDYVEQGVLSALDVVADITGTQRVNLLGLCLGGMTAACAVAHLGARAPDRVGSLTLLNTMLDFTDPGVLGCFVDDEAVTRLESRMRDRGYLEAGEMAGTFDVIRANDMIFGYVARSWLAGEQPSAFDILAWNADATRMPARMHATYLRSCYVENRLAQGRFELAGERLDLGSVRCDGYVVGARGDHIVPWTSAYRSARLLGGSTRFVLTAGGHIAGVVNPPSGRSRHRASADCPPDPEDWLERTPETDGSWWRDWARWIEPRAGNLRKPPKPGSTRFPPLYEGPGRYVVG